MKKQKKQNYFHVPAIIEDCGGALKIFNYYVREVRDFLRDCPISEGLQFSEPDQGKIVTLIKNVNNDPDTPAYYYIDPTTGRKMDCVEYVRNIEFKKARIYAIDQILDDKDYILAYWSLNLNNMKKKRYAEGVMRRIHRNYKAYCDILDRFSITIKEYGEGSQIQLRKTLLVHEVDALNNEFGIELSSIKDPNIYMHDVTGLGREEFSTNFWFSKDTPPFIVLELPREHFLAYPVSKNEKYRPIWIGEAIPDYSFDVHRDIISRLL